MDSQELERQNGEDFATEVLAVDNPLLIAAAIMDTTREIAEAIHVHSALSSMVVASIGARMLQRNGGRMADAVSQLADFLADKARESIQRSLDAELYALVALTKSAVAIEAIATGSTRRFYALQFFQAAVAVAEKAAPMGTGPEAVLEARRRVLLRIRE